MSLTTIPRSANRRSLRLIVKSRVRSRLHYVDLIDISEGGCKVRGSRGFGEVGDRVVLNVGGVNAPIGTIAWTENKITGIAFEGEMHSAVLDHLCTINGTRIARPKREESSEPSE